MPRTKRPAAKKAENSEGNDTDRKRIERWVAEQKKTLDKYTEMETSHIDIAFQLLVKSIPLKYLQMTVGQLKNELHLKEITNSTQTRQTATTTSHDDGYNTESSTHGSGEFGKKIMAPPSTASRSASRRRSRSADTSHRTAPSTVSGTSRLPQRRRSRSMYKTPAHNTNVYKTPAYNKNATALYPVITPKVAPHTPLTVLRQPRLGEMVVSMTGSPVMVANYSVMQRDEKASCNIELQDGTVLTVKPTQLRASQAFIPYGLMEPGVFDQIRTLKENLDKICSLREKVCENVK